MSRITSVLSLANDDAFENEFQVVIPAFPGCLDPVGFNIRVEKFTSPALSYEAYKVHYKTEFADKPSGKQSGEKKLTMTLRVDKEYKAFKSILNWYSIIHDTETGAASRDFRDGTPIFRVPITVMYQDANGEMLGTETYYNCFPVDIPQRAYTYDTGNPIKLDLSFYYSSMKRLK